MGKLLVDPEDMNGDMMMGGVNIHPERKMPLCKSSTTNKGGA
jgi:hypothetical protein